MGDSISLNYGYEEMSSGRRLQIPLHRLERRIVFSLNAARRECKYLSNMGVCTNVPTESTTYGSGPADWDQLSFLKKYWDAATVSGLLANGGRRVCFNSPAARDAICLEVPLQISGEFRSRMCVLSSEDLLTDHEC